MPRVGAVVIGRNEGERLKRCIVSLKDAVELVVYVDSGSTDGSVEFANEQGAEVVELDMSRPFTAARARNAGLKRLRERRSDIDLVQFVDGDCEVIDGWLSRAAELLEKRADAVIVCGRTQELNRSGTVYNRLCDMEFDHRAGDVDSCGGIFMGRAEPITKIGGFNETIIAGEEPELCLRLRNEDWKVVRIDDPMVWHDSAMTRFGQWWKRSVRSGHAYAEAMDRHGSGTERFGVRNSVSIWFWAFGPLVMAAALLWPTHYWSLVILLAYPMQACRIALRRRTTHGNRLGDALLYGVFLMIGKWAQVVGQCRYWLNRARHQQGGLIEYK